MKLSEAELLHLAQNYVNGAAGANAEKTLEQFEGMNGNIEKLAKAMNYFDKSVKGEEGTAQIAALLKAQLAGQVGDVMKNGFTSQTEKDADGNPIVYTGQDAVDKFMEFAQGQVAKQASQAQMASWKNYDQAEAIKAAKEAAQTHSAPDVSGIADAFAGAAGSAFGYNGSAQNNTFNDNGYAQNVFNANSMISMKPSMNGNYYWQDHFASEQDYMKALAHKNLVGGLALGIPFVAAPAMIATGLVGGFVLSPALASLSMGGATVGGLGIGAAALGSAQTIFTAGTIMAGVNVGMRLSVEGSLGLMNPQHQWQNPIQDLTWDIGTGYLYGMAGEAGGFYNTVQSAIAYNTVAFGVDSFTRETLKEGKTLQQYYESGGPIRTLAQAGLGGLLGGTAGYLTGNGFSIHYGAEAGQQMTGAINNIAQGWLGLNFAAWHTAFTYIIPSQSHPTN